tara:strand:+ start:1245 stop:2162 length:918 start_codon:yes stop_codon:yes gene_type:complete
MNCKNIENATRKQLQQNCKIFKSIKKTDCRVKTSSLLGLSKKLCAFYDHTLEEGAHNSRQKARITSVSTFDYSQLNEPLANEIAFPSDDNTLEEVSIHLYQQILKCHAKIPEISTFDIICVGTGMNTLPEQRIYEYLQKYLTKRGIRFRFVIYDPNYSETHMETIKSRFHGNISVTNKLLDPTKLNYNHGKVILAFSGIDGWIRNAHDIFTFMINMWYIIADRCNTGQKTAVIDVFYTYRLGDMFDSQHSIEKRRFSNFWACRFTDICFNTAILLQFANDDSPTNARRYAMSYACDENTLINPKI